MHKPALGLLGSLVALATMGACHSAGESSTAPSPGADFEDSSDVPEGDTTFPTPADELGPVFETTVHTPYGPFATKYRMRDGEAVAEGDILLPTGDLGVTSATSIGRHWPDALVPYVIDGNLPNPERVTNAIAHWEAKTKLRFVPRTTERDYVHFRSANSCSAFIGQAGGRQFVNLTTVEGAASLAAVGVDRTSEPERVYFFYKRGFGTAGTLARVNAYRSHFRYVLSPGKSPANLVDVAYANNGHLFAFYDDGTVSEGNHADFALYAPAKPYALAAGKTPADVAGVAIDASDRAYAYYYDGTFSIGTVTDLAVQSPQPFTVAPGRTPADLGHVDFGKSGAFYAIYNYSAPETDGGPPVIRATGFTIGTAQVLATTTPVGRMRYPGHCTTGATIHEIGHAVGLFHEQTRHDRDQFVRILWENIDPDERFNFEKHSLVVGTDTGPYDFQSIMHYGPKAFTANGEDTIVAVDGRAFVEQRSGLSPADIAGVHAMYP